MNISPKFIDEAWNKSIVLLKNDSRITARQRGFLQYARATDIAGNVIIIKVANEVTQDVLQTQIKNVFEETLRNNFDTNISCAYVIDPELEIKDQPIETPEEETESTTGKKNSRKTQEKSDETGQTGRLNPKYVFDSFVRGHSNRFAHAAALAVAEAPGQAYNPLFIYGDSGLGKTHLLHAIGNYSHKVAPKIHVRYVNAEEFTNDFINSIRDDEGVGFKTTYRNVDVLLMDDIQFFSGKDRTQEEFFHTFNTLHNMGKQIVITSDLPPKQLRGFEDRMRTRFEWGLITDVQPPELETRIAILRKKAIIEKLNINDDTLEYIATHVTTNIRKLEGALIRVAAFANLNRQEADTELAETVLKDLIINENASEITISTILAQTAEHFNLTIEEMKSTSRTRHLVTARQIAMYLCRELTSMSLPMIGQEFGGRDHTTVMHADRKIRELLQEKREIFNQVTELTNKIKSQQQI